MTNPGPWTATGQPETKKSRTWWIVGGVIVAALALFAAYLMGRGWDTAVATDADAELAEVVQASSVPLEVSETIPKLLPCSASMACIGVNNVRLDDVQSSIAAVMPREASEGLSTAIGDFQRAHSIYSTQWCEQEEYEICDESVSEMNDAIGVMQQIVR